MLPINFYLNQFKILIKDDNFDSKSLCDVKSLPDLCMKQQQYVMKYS